MSSKSRKLRMMPLRFQMMGGRSAPWMLQVRTALRPTVMVVTLTLCSSGRLSWTTSAKGKITGITSNTVQGSCYSSPLSDFLYHSGNNFGGFWQGDGVPMLYIKKKNKKLTINLSKRQIASVSIKLPAPFSWCIFAVAWGHQDGQQARLAEVVLTKKSATGGQAKALWLEIIWACFSKILLSKSFEKVQEWVMFVPWRRIIKVRLLPLKYR